MRMMPIGNILPPRCSHCGHVAVVKDGAWFWCGQCFLRHAKEDTTHDGKIGMHAARQRRHVSARHYYNDRPMAHA